MYSLIKKYADQNPEKFNKDFILSRNDDEILDYVKDIFKSLEILNEIKVESVTLETDESGFGPIRAQHHYYKSILPSRLNKIHYRLKITPSETVEDIPLLDPDDKTIQAPKENTGESFIKEGDLFINKLVDKCFYINEGVRYFLIYQVVDNATYGTKDCVSLKSLLMPITLMQNSFVAAPEFLKDPVELASYQVLLFSKKINPILYILGKDSYNSIVRMKVTNPDKIIEERQALRDPTLIDKFNKFFGTDIKFSENINELNTDKRTVFKIYSEKVKDSDQEKGLYFSVDTEKLVSDRMTKAVVGCILDLKNKEGKKKLVYTYDNLITPWYWIDQLSDYFTKNTDPMKKFEKIKTMLISLDRLMDESTRKILNIKEEDKVNTLTVIRYLMRDFEDLSKQDSQDLDNKRIRLFEYEIYPLRLYFSQQIYRVLNSSTRSKAILDRMFSNLSPMYIIKQTVVNELLRYYNSPNEMNLFSSLLKYTFVGPQSIHKVVSNEQRDLHPSYVGRVSLIASSAGDTVGIAGNLSPFVEVYPGGYFVDQNKKEEGS